MKINKRTAEWIVKAASQSASDKEKLAVFHLHYKNQRKLIQRILSARFDGLWEDEEKLGRAIANVSEDWEWWVVNCVQIASDYYFNAGTLEQCRKTVAIQSMMSLCDCVNETSIEKCLFWKIFSEEPVYLYTFEHWNPESLGALLSIVPIEGKNCESLSEFISTTDVTHACELFYFFKHSLFGASNPEVTEEQQRVIDRFTTAFTNFAKCGSVLHLRIDGTMSWQEPEWNGLIDITRSMGSHYKRELQQELCLRNWDLFDEGWFLWGEQNINNNVRKYENFRDELPNSSESLKNIAPKDIAHLCDWTYWNIE